METIVLEIANDVATVTLNRPDVLNSFNDRMGLELLDALRSCAKDPSVRCVVLTGAGRAFCAGEDLSAHSAPEVSGQSRLGEVLRRRYNPIIKKIRTMEKPFVAKVNGVAAGAGVSLALACDLVIACDKASFLQAFVKVGLVPDSGATWILPKLVGMHRAAELAFFGEKISAEYAAHIGMINRVVLADELDATVNQMAQTLANQPTKAIGLMKRMFIASATHTLEQHLEYEAYCQEVAGLTEDHREGVKAFFEKRAPSFKGC